MYIHIYDKTFCLKTMILVYYYMKKDNSLSKFLIYLIDHGKRNIYNYAN